MADVSVYNSTKEAVTVATSITRTADGTDVLSETTTIPPEESRSYENPVRESGTYRIEASTASGGSATFEWDAPDSSSSGVRIRITADGIDIGEVAA